MMCKLAAGIQKSASLVLSLKEQSLEKESLVDN